jgi:peptidoglycan/LPS O-acetylase OafA/YrhL
VAVMQFYFVFPLLMKGQKKYGNKFLLIIAFSSFALRMTCRMFIGWKAPFTFFPYLFEISIGAYLASVKEVKLSNKVLWILALSSLFVFCAGNYFYPVWFFTTATFLIMFLFCYPSIRKIVEHNKLLNKFFIYIGSISYYLFLVHGPLRFPLLDYAKQATALGKIGYSLLFFALSLIVAHLLKWLEHKVLALFKKKTHNS